MQSQQMTVPFDRLMHDAGANVRKHYDPESISEMKASILAHGIIQPIAVRPPIEGDADLGGQLYRIFAGGRRFRAMSELVAEKKLTPDYEVPIVVRDVDETAASEMSLAENMIREQMTPADEFRAFAKLVDQGMSVADVALRFGQTERYVKGRLALARLHPEILEAFEQGQISFAAACAYTTNPDVEIQHAFFTDGGWSRNPEWSIKSAMKRAAISADGPLATFIGEEAYKAAGGVIHEDLFGEDSHWVSGELIQQLRNEAIERHRQEALAEGWSFFATTEELGIDGVWRLRALQPEGSDLTEEDADRMQEIADELEGMMEDDPDAEKLQAEYDALEARENRFSAEQKAKAGIVIDMATMQIRVGVLKPDAKADDEDGDETLGGAAKEAEKAKKDPLALTQPLRDMIGEVASDALSAGVLADPHKALALVTAMLANADNHTMGVGRPTRIKVERVNYDYGSAKAEGSIKKSFDAFAKLSGEDLLKRFAGFTAQTVDLTERWFQKDGYTSDERRASTRSGFLSAFAANPLEFFDADAWFTACTKPMIDAAMKEMTGFSATKPKKADMAREAAEEARRTGWLPKELRLPGYKLHKDRQSAPAKPAAKAKKRKEV